MIKVIATALLAACLAWPAFAAERPGSPVAEGSETFQFEIPPQRLISAINAFIATTGWQVGFAAELAQDVTSPGLSGRYTAEDGLVRLLSGTGLTYRFTDEETVTLVRAGTPAQAKAKTDNNSQQPAEPAPTKEETETLEVPEVVIREVKEQGYVTDDTTTATKTDTPLIETPQSISVITRERLAVQDVSTLNEAMRYTPGIQVEAFGNDSRVDFLRFRGFNDNGNAIFRDGLQLRNSAFGQFRTELYGMERVDVLRGPSSFLYGQGNPGGLVNMVTKRPTLEPFREVEIEAGNFNHLEGKFDLSGPVDEAGRFSYRLTGLGRNADTQVDFVENDRLFLAPAMTWRPGSRTSLTLLGHIQHDLTGSTNQFLPAAGTLQDNPNGDIPPSRFTGEPDFDQFDRTEYSIGYLLEHRLNRTWTFRQKLRYSHLDVDVEQVFGGGLAPDQRTLTRFAFTALAETDGLTLDNHAQARFTTGPLAHTLLVGVGYQRYDFEEAQGFALAPSLDIFNPEYGADIPTPPLFLDTDIIQEQVGLYGQDQVTLFDNWILTLSGRGDFLSAETNNQLTGETTEQDDTEFSGRAGLVYRSDVGLAPYAAFSQAFLPTLGTNVAGEPFEPTTSQGYEGGLKYQPPGWNSFVTVAAFNIRQQNVLTPDPDNPVDQVQTGEIRSCGVELEGVASLDWGLNVIAAYTFQDVQVTESNAADKGKRPVAVPKHLGSVWADYTWQDGLLTGLGVGAGVRYRGDRFGDSINTLKVDDFTVVDATIFYNWKGFHFNFITKNLFDNEYVASCTSTAACFFGPVRTVVGSIGYRW